VLSVCYYPIKGKYLVLFIINKEGGGRTCVGELRIA